MGHVFPTRSTWAVSRIHLRRGSRRTDGNDSRNKAQGMSTWQHATSLAARDELGRSCFSTSLRMNEPSIRSQHELDLTLRSKETNQYILLTTRDHPYSTTAMFVTFRHRHSLFDSCLGKLAIANQVLPHSSKTSSALQPFHKMP